MSSRQKFHPIAIASYWLQTIKQWGFYILLLVLNNGLRESFTLLALVAIALLALVQALIKYFTRTYVISPEKIIIYHGFFRKKETDIPYERIQTIKQRQWFFYKPFNIIQILIETAGGSKKEAEGDLPAVAMATLQLLESYRHRAPLENETEQAATHTYHVTDEQIILFGLTDLSILASLTALMAFGTELIPDSWYTNAVTSAEDIFRRGWVFMVGIVFIVLLLIMLISLAKNFFQFYNFKVSRSNQTLTIESGLLERKVQKVPVDKIQGIRIRQQLLRKLLKLSTVEIMLAGGQEQQGENNVPKKLYVFPIISDQSLYSTLDALLPEWQMQQPYIVLASTKNSWYFWRWYLLTLPLIGGSFYFNLYVGILSVSATAFLLLCAWLDFRYQGYAIQTESRLCLQTFEALTKVQTFVERPKIQAVSNQTSKWLYPKQIGHTSMAIKTGLGTENLRLKFINQKHQEILKQFYKPLKSP